MNIELLNSKTDVAKHFNENYMPSNFNNVIDFGYNNNNPYTNIGLQHNAGMDYMLKNINYLFYKNKFDWLKNTIRAYITSIGYDSKIVDSTLNIPIVKSVLAGNMSSLSTYFISNNLILENSYYKQIVNAFSQPPSFDAVQNLLSFIQLNVLEINNFHHMVKWLY